MTKQLKSSAKTFTGMSSEDRKSEWLSNKLKIMSKSNTIVQVVAVDIQVGKFTNPTADGWNYVRRWENNKLIGFITFLLTNVSVSYGI